MKIITIGLLWHSFKSGNLGVGALSICNFRIIEQELRRLNIRARYVIVGNSGLLDYMPEDLRENAEFVHFSAKKFLQNPLSILNSIRNCDVVFDIGEGDSFADIYGIGRLAKLSLSKFVTTSTSGNLVFSPQTIGPFSTVPGKALARYLTHRSFSVVARDYMSKAVLDELDAPRQAEAIDVAFLLPYDKGLFAHLPTTKPRIGINVSGLLFHGGYNGRNQFGLACDYKAFTLALIQSLLDDGRYEVHLVPHVVSENNPIEDDYAVSEMIKQSMPGVVLPPARFTDPIMAKSYIAGMDFFTGARMHSTIGAFSSGVPVAPLAYSRKFAGLFESIGYKEVLDMRALGQAELIQRIKSGIEMRGIIAEHVQAGLRHVDQKIDVYRNVVGSMLTKVAGS